MKSNFFKDLVLRTSRIVRMTQQLDFQTNNHKKKITTLQKINIMYSLSAMCEFDHITFWKKTKTCELGYQKKWKNVVNTYEDTILQRTLFMRPRTKHSTTCCDILRRLATIHNKLKKIRCLTMRCWLNITQIAFTMK